MGNFSFFCHYLDSILGYDYLLLPGWLAVKNVFVSPKSMAYVFLFLRTARG